MTIRNGCQVPQAVHVQQWERASNPQLGWGRNVPQSHLDQEKTTLERTPERLLLRGGTRKVGDQEGEAKPLCVKCVCVCVNACCVH